MIYYIPRLRKSKQGLMSKKILKRYKRRNDREVNEKQTNNLTEKSEMPAFKINMFRSSKQYSVVVRSLEVLDLNLSTSTCYGTLHKLRKQL